MASCMSSSLFARWPLKEIGKADAIQVCARDEWRNIAGCEINQDRSDSNGACVTTLLSRAVGSMNDIPMQ